MGLFVVGHSKDGEHVYQNSATNLNIVDFPFFASVLSEGFAT